MARAYVYDDSHSPQIAKRLGQGNRQINQLIWQDLQQISYDTREAASRFRKPALIIQGEQNSSGRKQGRTLTMLFPILNSS